MFFYNKKILTNKYYIIYVCVCVNNIGFDIRIWIYILYNWLQEAYNIENNVCQ